MAIGGDADYSFVEQLLLGAATGPAVQGSVPQEGDGATVPPSEVSKELPLAQMVTGEEAISKDSPAKQLLKKSGLQLRTKEKVTSTTIPTEEQSHAVNVGTPSDTSSKLAVTKSLGTEMEKTVSLTLSSWEEIDPLLQKVRKIFVHQGDLLAKEKIVSISKAAELEDCERRLAESVTQLDEKESQLLVKTNEVEKLKSLLARAEA